MFRVILIAVTALFGATQANAVTASYTDRSTFLAALTSYTEIPTLPVAQHNKTTAQLSAETVGATFFGPASNVRSPDGVILNGAGLFGSATPHVGLNFVPGVHAVGVTTNLYDGGDIEIYSGADGTGTLLGEADFGDGQVLFGGITSTQAIGSAIFTCEFNFDLICGLIDPVFGDIALSQVPLPATLPLSLAAFGLLLRRRRKA